jgi:chemotaxis response regulator CheB
MVNETFAVAIAASGSGIDCMLRFFKDLEDTPGAAYFVVTHLNRERQSALDRIISRHTTMPVVKVQEATPIVANHVYVIAEGTYMYVKNGHIHTKQRPDGNINVAIDELFTSVAACFGAKAVGVILWGFGTQGVEGITAIEDNGGYVIVQMPEGSIHSEMATNAIKKDSPHIVLPLSEIGPHLQRYLGKKVSVRYKAR